MIVEPEWVLTCKLSYLGESGERLLILVFRALKEVAAFELNGDIVYLLLRLAFDQLPVVGGEATELSTSFVIFSGLFALCAAISVLLQRYAKQQL